MLKPSPSLLISLAVATLSSLSIAFASTTPASDADSTAAPAPTRVVTGQTPTPASDQPSLCDRGAEQSPIDISSVYPYRYDYRRNPAHPTRIDPPRLRFVMFPTSLEVTRETDGVRAHVSSGSYTRVNRERYDLNDIRFRTPAEHLVNGHRYPAEIQLMHRHDNAQAIFSVFVEEGSTVNPVLNEIISNAPHLVGETNSFRRRRIDTALLLPGDKGFFLYDGSLSSPPCTEKVMRFVMKSPIQASRTQILALRGLAGDTARPVQAIGKRMVLQTGY